jgi:diketogulonate reductase-like aldo/keto reductase
MFFIKRFRDCNNIFLVAQIALKWLINKKNIVTIPKSLNKKHLEANLDVFNLDINEEDLHLLDVMKA